MPIKKKKIVEKVVAFEGEQDFIVNSNKPDYISSGEVLFVQADGTTTNTEGIRPTITGETPPTSASSGSLSGGSTASGGTTPQSPTVPSYIVPDWTSLDCNALTTSIGQLETYISTYSASISPSDLTNYQSELSKANSLKSTKCDFGGNTTPIPTYTIPDWATLSCDSLKAEISKLQSWLSQNENAVGFRNATRYKSEIDKANSLYQTKCAVTPTQPIAQPTTTVTSTTTFMPPFPMFGGGGGGSSDTTTTVEKKSGFPYLLLILIAGGLFLITRKDKK